MTTYLNLRSGNSGAPFVGTADLDTLLWSAAEEKWYAGPGGGGGAVTSVFGRTGAVAATAGDYDSDQVDNVSGVAGATVSDALDTLALSAGAVTSVFGRTGVVVAVAGDYDSDQVDNVSSVSGTTVSDALDALFTRIITSANWQGGLREVADLAARNAIPSGNRDVGMSVYEVDTDQMWRLIGGVTNADWVNVTVGLVTNLVAGLVPAVGAINTVLQSTGAAAAWGANLVLGATPATSGNVRLTHGSTIVEKNFLGSGNQNVYVSAAGSDIATFGDSVSARTNLDGGNSGGVALRTNSIDRLTLNSSFVIFAVPELLIGAATAPTGFVMDIQNVASGSNATSLLKLRAGGTTSGNTNGTNVELEGGRLSGSGLSGGFVSALNQDDTVANRWVMLQVKHVATGQRVTALNFPGAAGVGLTTTQMPANSGDLVTFIGNANTVPSADAGATSGFILYGDGGKPGFRYNGVNLRFDGIQTTVGAAGAASALPVTPSGYKTETINGTAYAVPYYLAA